MLLLELLKVWQERAAPREGSEGSVPNVPEEFISPADFARECGRKAETQREGRACTFPHTLLGDLIGPLQAAQMKSCRT